MDKHTFSNNCDLIFKYPLYANALTNKGLIGFSSIAKYPKNSLTVTARGELGKAFVRKTKFNASGRLLILLQKVDLDLEFISNYINGKLNIFIENTGVPQLTAPNFKTYKIKIPIFKEQQKIGEFFSFIDEKIELMEKKYLFIKKYKKGLMQKIFSQEITFKCNDKEWEVKKIGDYLIESKIVGEDNINKRLTVKLNLNGVYPRDTTTVERIGATRQYIRKAGQFIYGKQNLFKGAFGIIPDYLDGYLSSSDIPSFDFKENINPIWFYYYFSRESFYTKLEDLSTGTGSKRVAPNDFLKIKIGIPSLKEQDKIADFLSEIDNKIDSVEQQLEKIKEFKKYLLQQMFV